MKRIILNLLSIANAFCKFYIHYSNTGEQKTPIILVVSTKFILIFEEYKKTCKKCPVESVCWEPKLLEDPVPLNNLLQMILFDFGQLIALEMNQTVTQFFFFKSDVIKQKLFHFQNANAKANLLLVFSELLNENLTIKNDPISDLYYHILNNTPENSQIIKLKKNQGDKIISTVFFCCNVFEMFLYELKLDQWEYIPDLEQISKNNLLSGEDREKLKTDLDSKIVCIMLMNRKKELKKCKHF